MDKARNAGKKWTPDSDRELLILWERRTSIDRICAGFGRTEMAIASRLVLLDRYADLDAALAEIEQRRGDTPQE